MKTLLSKYREVNSYIKDNFLKLSIILFGVHILAMVITYFVVASYPPPKMEAVTERLNEVYDVENMVQKNNLELFWAIFVHNLKATGISIASAITPFLFYPVWHVISNGINSGMVYGMTSSMGFGNMVVAYLKFVLPHAIFEIPISILCSAIGLRWCVWLLQKMFGKGKDVSLQYHFEKLSEILVMYIIPFLLIAALLEAIVEPWLFGM